MHIAIYIHVCVSYTYYVYKVNLIFRQYGSFIIIIIGIYCIHVYIDQFQHTGTYSRQLNATESVLARWSKGWQHNVREKDSFNNVHKDTSVVSDAFLTDEISSSIQYFLVGNALSFTHTYTYPDYLFERVK